MYLRNNIWGSHRRDQLRKNAFISLKVIAAASFLFFVGEAGLPPSQMVALPIKARTS